MNIVSSAILNLAGAILYVYVFEASQEVQYLPYMQWNPS